MPTLVDTSKTKSSQYKSEALNSNRFIEKLSKTRTCSVGAQLKVKSCEQSLSKKWTIQRELCSLEKKASRCTSRAYFLNLEAFL